MSLAQIGAGRPPVVGDRTAPGSAGPAEHFIPYRRQDVVEMCLQDGGLSPEQHQSFRELCEILTATLHFDFRRFGDNIRNHYVWFDPDRDTRVLEPTADRPGHEQEVVALLRTLAERANFFEVTTEQIRKAFDTVTLIDVSTHVDLDDFDRVLCFARGDIFKPTQRKSWFRTQQIDVDVLERVILLLKFKGEDYFQTLRRKRKQRESSLFQPGAIYLYLYKDVPKNDIELLFPNVRVSMNLRQKILFAVPAVGASVGVLLKALPQFLIIVAVILFLIGGRGWAARLGVDEEKLTGVMPVLTATIALVAALGGLAVKQWTSYKNKQIQYLKDVGEQLFFRNLATNRAAFARLIESAEEEESKEMILLLYHLLKNRTEPVTREQLDREIEGWMQRRFGTVIDFDINGPIRYLEQLRAPNADGLPCAVLHVDDAGRLQAASINESKRILDARWDDYFRFSDAAPGELSGALLTASVRMPIASPKEKF